MRRFGHLLLCAAWLGYTGACTTGRGVRPVGRGQAAVGASVGGPLVRNLGLPVPLPVSSLILRVGMTQRTDLDVALYAPVVRAFGAEMGVSHLFWPQLGARPALMLGLHVLRLLQVGRETDGRAAPQADGRPAAAAGHGVDGLFLTAAARASWALTPGQLLFVGLDGLGRLGQPAAVPAVRLGWQGQLQPRWRLQTEVSYMAWTQSHHDLVVHYLGLGPKGALGLQVALSYQFPLSGRAATPAKVRRQLPGHGRWQRP